MVVAILVVLAVSGLGAWWSLSTGDRTEERAVSASAPTPAMTLTETGTVETKPEEAPVTHVTFGSHTTATQPCVSCHPDDAKPGTIACRDCHKNVCGKDAKTVGDCLECHQTGTTGEWAP